MRGLHGLAGLPLLLQAGLGGLPVLFVAGQLGGLGLPVFTLFAAEQLDAIGARLPLFQLLTGLAGLLEDALREAAVDFAAGQLFQQLGTLVGAGFEEGGKTSLG